MTIFKNYASYGKSIEEVNEPVTEKNLERYLKEYSLDAGEVFAQALGDIIGEVENILWETEGQGRLPHSAAKVKTALSKFHKEKISLLVRLKSELEKRPTQPRLEQD